MKIKNLRIHKTSYSVFISIFLFSLFLSLLFLSVSFAAENSANIDISCGEYQYPWCQESGGNPSGLIGQFYKIALGAVGACALGVLIYGSILWTVSGAVSTKQDAKEWISAALWGLALLLAAYLILYTINPDLVSIGKTGGGLEDLIKPIGN
jgi:hypothetical protein